MHGVTFIVILVIYYKAYDSKKQLIKHGDGYLFQISRVKSESNIAFTRCLEFGITDNDGQNRNKKFTMFFTKRTIGI